MKHPTLPYFRPEEPTGGFAEIAERYLDRYQPVDPEMEALVYSLIYTAWRIQRYRLDEAMLELHSDRPGQPHALAVLRTLLASLEKIYCWLLSAVEFWPRIHTLDASEAMESKAITHNLGSFLHFPEDLPKGLVMSPPPPRTKPN